MSAEKDYLERLATRIDVVERKLDNLLADSKAASLMLSTVRAGLVIQPKCSSCDKPLFGVIFNGVSGPVCESCLAKAIGVVGGALDKQ